LIETIPLSIALPMTAVTLLRAIERQESRVGKPVVVDQWPLAAPARGALNRDYTCFQSGEIAMRLFSLAATMLGSGLTVVGAGPRAAPLPPDEPDEAAGLSKGLWLQGQGQRSADASDLDATKTPTLFATRVYHP
jgi:hypothetical protein